MKTYIINNDQQFELQVCISCGCNFMMPIEMGQQLRKSKVSFYCPSGHSQSYTESEADRLRRQLEQEKASNKLLRETNERLRKKAEKPTTKRRAMRKAI